MEFAAKRCGIKREAAEILNFKMKSAIAREKKDRCQLVMLKSQLPQVS